MAVDGSLIRVRKTQHLFIRTHDQTWTDTISKPGRLGDHVATAGQAADGVIHCLERVALRRAIITDRSEAKGNLNDVGSITNQTGGMARRCEEHLNAGDLMESWLCTNRRPDS